MFGTEDYSQMSQTFDSINKTSIDKSNNDSKMEPKLKTSNILKSSKPSLSETMTREVDKNSVLNKKPTFLMTKSPCIVKLFNSDNKIGNNSSKSSNKLVLKLLSPEKNKEQDKSGSDSLIRSQLQSPSQKMRLWIPKCPLSPVYKLVPISHTNGMPFKLESDEPESDLICDDEFFRYLGLIGSKKLCSESINSFNSWPLRAIAGLKTLPKRNSDGDIILSDICEKPVFTFTETNNSSNLSEANREISRRKLAKHQWLEEVKDNTQRLVQQNQIEKQRDENSRKRDKELRDWKKEALNLISSFDISSVMGKRIFRSLFEALNDLDKYLLIIKCENHCLNNLFKFLSLSSVYVTNSTSVSRITRTRDGMDWNPRHYQHNYCFNRMQRLEKYKRVETGLDWRSRLLKSHCKRIYIKIKKLINCPLCSQTIDSEHQCYDFDEDLSDDSNSEVIPQQNNQIIIIGDDFNNNELKSQDQIKANNCCNSDIDCSQEDDDVIFIEEVIQTKNVFKLRFEANKPVISSSDSTQAMPFVKLKRLQTSNDLNRDSDSLMQKIEGKDFVFGSDLFNK